jgi:hypothetical protein
MEGAQIVAAHTQMAMRAGNGNATAVMSIVMKTATQADARTAARGEGRISIRPEQAAAQRRVSGIARNIARDEITRQVRIGQFEKLGKCRELIDAGAGEVLAQVPQQQEIQLLHAAPATPFQFAYFV